MQRSCQTILSRKLLEMGYSINIDQKKQTYQCFSEHDDIQNRSHIITLLFIT